MAETEPRRKVLCVRPRPNPNTAPMLANVVDEWVHTLALHCDVSVIEQDFDFAEVYEQLKPDFLIFDSVHWGRPHRLNIANAQAHPHVPRALYLNCDPHDPMRPLILQMLDNYGIDTVFCTGNEQIQHMPELLRIASFILPKFIDPTVFQDYKLDKIIPVTVFSGHLFPSFYPWRAQVTEEIQRLFPTLVYTHPGYDKNHQAPFEVRDEKYSQLISQSYFSIADTTRMDYVVRKHLEIPASGAILVAPESEPLKEYGFVDLENCVLGSGRELYIKINAISRSPDLYSYICKQGHDLVHSRYTRQLWTHMLDWFECRIRLQPGEIVQQQGKFGSFENVRANPGTPWIADAVIFDSPMSAVLRSARDTILSGEDLASTKAALNDLTNWIGHVAEPWLLLGVIALLEGDLNQAALWLSRRGNAQGQSDPELGRLDPVEIAWLLMLAELLEDEGLRDLMLERALDAPHLSIRRMRWLWRDDEDEQDGETTGVDGFEPGDCLSIHWLGQEDLTTWIALAERVLAANGRADRIRYGAVLDGRSKIMLGTS